MTTDNPYAAPAAPVTEAPAEAGDYGELSLWSPKGRIGRVRFLAYNFTLILIWYLLTTVLSIAVGVFATSGIDVTLPDSLVSLVVFLPLVAVAVLSLFFMIRRLHDVNRSGWFALFGLVPVANVIAVIALWFIPGSREANDYGRPPPPNSTGAIVMGVLAPTLFVLLMGMIVAIAIPAYQDYIDRAEAAAQGR